MAIRRLNKKEMDSVYKRFLFYEGNDWKQFQKSCEQNGKYYLGYPFSKDEYIAKQENGDYIVQINKIRKFIDALTGLLTASRPKYYSIAVSKEDSYASSLVNKALDYSWDRSDGLEKFRNATLMGLRDNIGYLFVAPDKHGDVVFTDLDYTDVLIDPRSRDPLFKDADYVYIKRWMSVEAAKAKYGVTDIRTDRPRQWRKFLGSLGEESETGQLFDNTKQYVCIYEGYHKVFEPITQMMSNGESMIVGHKQKIKVEIQIGYDHVEEYMLPEQVTEYPIIPFYAVHLRNPYKLGEIPFLIEIQDYINSSMGTLLKSADLNARPKVIMAQEAINGNVEEWKKSYANGDEINFVNDQEGLSAIKVIQGQPINSAFVSLLQIFMSEFEKATMPDSVKGFKDSSIEAKGLLMEKREAVMDSFKLITGHIDAGLTQLGKVVYQFTRAFMTTEKITKILGLDELKKDLEFATNQGLQLGNPDQEQEWFKAQMQKGFNPYEVQDQLNNARNAYETLKASTVLMPTGEDISVDIRIKPGSHSPSYNSQQFNILLQLRNQAGIQIPDDILLEYAPVEDNKKIADEVNLLKRVVEENKQLRENLELAEEQIRRLEVAHVESGKKQEMLEFKGKLDKRLNDQTHKMRADRKIANTQMNAYKVVTKNKLDASAEKALSDFKHNLELMEKEVEEKNETYDINKILRGE